MSDNPQLGDDGVAALCGGLHRLPNKGQLEQLGLRNTRELRTLAESLDALLKGDLPALGDLPRGAGR